MSNKGGNSARNAPADVDWALLSKHFTRYGLRRGVRREDAKQLAQQAICQALDPDHVRYDPDVHGTFYQFMFRIMNGLIANHQRRKESSSWFVPETATLDEASSPEEQLIAAEQAAMGMEMLRQRTAGDPVARGLIELRLADIRRGAEQAERLGVGIEEVYEANKRIVAHMAAIAIILGGN